MSDSQVPCTILGRWAKIIMAFLVVISSAYFTFIISIFHMILSRKYLGTILVPLTQLGYHPEVCPDVTGKSPQSSQRSMYHY